MPKISPKITQLFGVVVTLLSIGFVVVRSKQIFAELPTDALSSKVLLTLIAMGMVYAAAEILLVLAWKKILDANEIKSTFRSAFVMWGRSQIAKYLPGNVFHIASKQIILTQHGASARAAAKANITELASLAISALVLSWWALPNLFQNISVLVAIAGWLLTSALLIGIYFYMVSRDRRVIAAWGLQTLFLVLTGILFFALTRTFGGFPEPNFNDAITTSGMYILAWLVGFITPGASAGIGIRESALLLFGSGLPAETIALSSLGMRVVSILGDVIIFMVSFLWKGRIDESV